MLTGLNPWTVAAHFLLSMAIIAVTVVLAWRAARPDDGPPRPVLGRELTWLVRAVVGLVAGVLVLGTVVTGSGPHAGDEAAARTGFDPATVSQLHADAVMLLVGLTVAVVLWLRAVRRPGRGAPGRRDAARRRAGAGRGRLRAVLHRPAGGAGGRPPARRLPGLDRGGPAAAGLQHPGAGRSGGRLRRHGPSTPRPDAHSPRSGPALPVPAPVRHHAGVSDDQRRVAGGPAPAAPAGVEQNGINVIAESERKGRPRDLFWPWFAANISVLGVSYGAFVARLRRLLLAGRRSPAWSASWCRSRSAGWSRSPASAARRRPWCSAGRPSASAATGCRRALSWLLTVGWETVLVILATLATATVLDRLGWGGGTGTKLLAMVAGGGRHDRRRRARLRLHHAAADRRSRSPPPR